MRQTRQPPADEVIAYKMLDEARASPLPENMAVRDPNEEKIKIDKKSGRELTFPKKMSTPIATVIKAMQMSSQENPSSIALSKKMSTFGAKHHSMVNY